MQLSRQLIGTACVLWGLAGCNFSTPPADSQSAESDGPKPKGPPTAAITAPPPQSDEPPIDGMDFVDDEDAEAVEDAEHLQELPEGSPEWTLRELAKLRVMPLPPAEKEDLRKVQKERLDKIIEMATDVIKQTHKNKDKDRLFTVAVHHMLEARTQLALFGDEESIDVLYEDAATLWERDRNSVAAADAAFALVNLAYSNAKSTNGKDARWLEEFAKQSKHFAQNFPQEQRRSLPMLFAAARSCELNEQTELAVDCFNTLHELAPESVQAQRGTGILRRLNLVGQKAAIAGPGLDGQPIDIAQYQGKVLIVCYWTSAAKQSLEDLPVLTQMQTKYGKHGLQVIGVCLDESAETAQKVIDEHQLAWPHLFFTQPGQSGWSNPVAVNYGVMEVANWVLDQEGKVVTTSFQTKDVQSTLFPLLKKNLPAKSAAKE